MDSDSQMIRIPVFDHLLDSCSSRKLFTKDRSSQVWQFFITGKTQTDKLANSELFDPWL